MTATVLVVEDEADLMLTMRILLVTAGFGVVEATTGEEALVLLRGLVPDAMVLDLVLPGIDGWGVLATIRSEHLIPDIPIVVASANALPDQQVRAAEYGCAAVFTKPFRPERLLTTLRELTGMAPSPPRWPA